MAEIIPFPRKPRLVDAIEAVESLDSFGYDLPCDSGEWENNLRADGTPIVTTSVLETRGKEPA